MEATNLLRIKSQRSLNAWLACTLVILLASGCAPPPKPDTSLYGKAIHTGTLYSYRVPPVKSDNKRIPRFSPLRESMDLAEFVNNKGTIRSDLHVTKDDLITVSLSSAFIKYFREVGARGGSSGPDLRKGEIVVVLSFEAGTTKRESFVVFSSGEQTLGSFLSVQDWPMLGPIKVDGNHLKLRIVMIELDQAENEKIKQLTRSIGNTAGQIQPALAPVLRVAQPLVEAIIALNGDDIIFDQRFALQHVEKGAKRTSIQNPPLLFGKYVLLLQEDRLKGEDVSAVAKEATDPPSLSKIRFDLHSNRLYRLYDYWTDQWGWPRDGKGDLILESELPPDGTVPKVEDLSIISNLGGCGTEYLDEHPDAVNVRTQVLGYDNKHTSSMERWYCLQEALLAAYCEGLRGRSATATAKNTSDAQQSTTSSGEICDEAKFDAQGRLHLNYPLTIYPTANAVLAQYPLHTHIVLTIDKSFGGENTPVHETLASYEEFTKEQLSNVKDGAFAQQIGNRLIDALVQNRTQTVLLEKVKTAGDKNKQLCLLFDGLSRSGSPKPLNDAPLYNEIYHISGEALTTRKEVAEYLSSRCADPKTCSCAQEVQTELSQNKDAADKQQPAPTNLPELSLKDPPMTGELVTLVQKALAKKGFTVNDEKSFFGPITKQAVEAFQKANNLMVDGVVGSDTRKTLGIQ